MHEIFMLHKSEPTFSVFWGNFLGAFFAFVFGLLTYILTKRRERFIQHKNALIRLERLLDEHLYQVSILQEIATITSSTVADRKTTYHRLFPVIFPDNIDVDLGSLDLVNRALFYKATLNQLNINTIGINHALELLENLFMNKHEVISEKNFGNISNIIQSLIQDLPRRKEDIEYFLAITQINIRNMNERSALVYGILHSQWEIQVTPSEITEQLQHIRQEANEKLVTKKL